MFVKSVLVIIDYKKYFFVETSQLADILTERGASQVWNLIAAKFSFMKPEKLFYTASIKIRAP